ncbi:phosphopantetheine-binding protein, partial [Chromobacterium piscinae]
AEAGTGRQYLQLLYHHLAIDHTTLERLLDEVRQLQQGQGASLPPSLPFRQFVAQARLGVGAAEHEAYFRAQLGEVEEPTLPFGLQGYLGNGGDIEEARLNLSPELAGQLRRQARRLGVSVACLAHLAWGQVLARASGKALPAPDGSQLSSRAYAAPEGEAETTLAAIWSELLGVERVGRHDNFFELGGHSLLAVTLPGVRGAGRRGGDGAGGDLERAAGGGASGPPRQLLRTGRTFAAGGDA